MIDKINDAVKSAFKKQICTFAILLFFTVLAKVKTSFNSDFNLMLILAISQAVFTILMAMYCRKCDNPEEDPHDIKSFLIPFILIFTGHFAVGSYAFVYWQHYSRMLLIPVAFDLALQTWSLAQYAYARDRALEYLRLRDQSRKALSIL